MRARTKRWVSVKPRACLFCQKKTAPDYKLPEVLRSLTSERGKILSAERIGLCPQHQRRLSLAVKRARFLGLLPYVSEVK